MSKNKKQTSDCCDSIHRAQGTVSPYFGLSLQAIEKKFTGGPFTFLGETPLRNDVTYAIYRATSPDRSKGHKDLLLIHVSAGGGWVSGMNLEEFEQYRTTDALKCLGCKKVLYSSNRHHFNRCGCENETFIDGGRDYCRYGGKEMAKIQGGTFDFLTGKFKPAKKEGKKKKKISSKKQ